MNFTGSTHVGRIIAVKCAEHMKRCLLELGGKAPMVVLPAPTSTPPPTPPASARS